MPSSKLFTWQQEISAVLNRWKFQLVSKLTLNNTYLGKIYKIILDRLRAVLLKDPTVDSFRNFVKFWTNVALKWEWLERFDKFFRISSIYQTWRLLNWGISDPPRLPEYWRCGVWAPLVLSRSRCTDVFWCWRKICKRARLQRSLRIY